MTFSNPVNLCKALGQLIAAVAATESEAEIYTVVASYLPQLIPSDRASIALVKPDQKTFSVFALEGGIADPPLGSELPLDKTNNVGRCFLKKAPCLSNLEQDSNSEPVASSSATQQVMSTPLIVGEDVIGTINLATCQSNFYGASELELLTQIAVLVVTNIERQRLTRRLRLSMERHRSYAERLEILNEMGRKLSSASSEQKVFQIVFEATQKVLSVERVSYAIPDLEGESFQIYALLGNDAIPKSVQVPLANSSIESVITENKALLYLDLATSKHPEHAQLHQQGLNQACSTPVQIAGKTIGVLNAGISQPWDYPEESVMLLSALGRFMGTTLERIQALEEVDTTLSELEYQASHDELTGLPNRSFLHQALETELENSQNSQQPFAVLFVDLDHFKEVNDSLSHSIGDQLLCAVASRMLTKLREKDLVARTGGDEFIVLLRQVSSEADAARLADRLLRALRQPFQIEGHQIQVGGSIGISLFPQHGLSSAALMKHADIAMYAAKHKGRNNYQLYVSEMSEQLNARITLGNHLSRAIEKQEFFLLFQPLFDLQSDKVVGVEALIRWRHPTLGLVSPGVFITIAEESGLIGEITIWVLGESLKVLKMLREMNPQLYMSVNISAQELVTPQVLTQHIEAALARFDLPGNALELELTERVFLDYPEMAINVIQTWKSQGIRLAIDDFGTGFSSLNYLLNLPMDTLKIDRSFVKSIHSNERKQGVVKTILALGENLGATCVAEGVEEKEQLDFLRQLGCQKIQGFFLARPMPAEQVVQLLVQQEEHSDQGDAVWSQAA